MKFISLEKYSKYVPLTDLGGGIAWNLSGKLSPLKFNESFNSYMAFNFAWSFLITVMVLVFVQ